MATARLQSHPHVHALVTDGLLEPDGAFLPLNRPDLAALAELFAGWRWRRWSTRSGSARAFGRSCSDGDTPASACTGPGTPRPRGGDPYAIPLRDKDDFIAWYRAYRHDLALPERDHDFLGPFHEDIVAPLGRVPRPKLMRAMQDRFATYRKVAESETGAVRELFRGLRAVVAPLDFDRIRWSNRWAGPLQELGLLDGR